MSNLSSCPAAAAVEVLVVRTRLVEASQQRDQAAIDRDQLRAEVKRLEAEAIKASEAHRAELSRLAEEHGKAVADKNADLKATVDKSARFEKELETRGRTWALERNEMLCEAQHLDELLTCWLASRPTFCLANCLFSSSL